MLRSLLLAMLVLAAASSAAADVPSGYQKPPADLVRVADAPLPPRILPGPHDGMLLEELLPLLPISEVAQPELKLAGLRWNPTNESESRSVYWSKLSFVDVGSGATRPVSGVPADGRIRQPTWSPDGSHVAFTVARPLRVELWVADRSDGVARRVSELPLNGAHPQPTCHWLGDSRALVCRVIPADRGPVPTPTVVPSGPLVEENLGKKTPAPTFQDLLHDENDAVQFEHHLSSELWILGLDGKQRRIGPAALYLEAAPSPDGSAILVTSLHRPFSYHVAEDRFPRRSEVWDLAGKRLAVVADLPLAVEVPIDFDAARTGRRDIGWRTDAPATLWFIEARDGGNPKATAAIRDELSQLAAPFTGPPRKLASLPLRFAEVLWSSGKLAIVRERWWKTRREHEWRLMPDAATPPKQLTDRSYEDRYGDPGLLQLAWSTRGTPVLWTDAGGELVTRFGDGASPEGDRPFVDQQDLKSGQTTRRWRSAAPSYEHAVALLGDGQRVVSRRESPSEPPNLLVRTLASNAILALTHIPHPYPALRTVKRELIQYKRADGLPLSGTLYTPPGYDGKKRLPVLLWAYPREFKAAGAAGQVQDSPYRFPRVSWASPLFWLLRGYAILDNPAFPIVGEGEAQPNDTYVQQLVGDASAAVDELVRRGVGDRERMAIGGHSYGAFTTTNLLAHSRLFRAGIARSGAYNRTLTPFGFQSEERDLWEATATYVEMSPFTHANQIADALLLIHGMEDDNQGTFPLQSERLFAALKGLGKTARLVLLPREAHGYRARESILHMLWEMDRWLEQYVKNAPPRPIPPPATARR
jgi:dipeptidyl aminopeptidase/acylaminoacyl peptidase